MKSLKNCKTVSEQSSFYWLLHYIMANQRKVHLLVALHLVKQLESQCPGYFNQQQAGKLIFFK